MALAQVLRDRPQADWRDLAGRLICDAHAADLYRQTTGRAHPFWGDGSVLSRVLKVRTVPIVRPNDPDYLRAIAMSASELRRAVLETQQQRTGGVDPELAV